MTNKFKIGDIVRWCFGKKDRDIKMKEFKSGDLIYWNENKNDKGVVIEKYSDNYLNINIFYYDIYLFKERKIIWVWDEDITAL